MGIEEVGREKRWREEERLGALTAASEEMGVKDGGHCAETSGCSHFPGRNSVSEWSNSWQGNLRSRRYCNCCRGRSWEAAEHRRWRRSRSHRPRRGRDEEDRRMMGGVE